MWRPESSGGPTPRSPNRRSGAGLSRTRKGSFEGLREGHVTAEAKRRTSRSAEKEGEQVSARSLDRPIGVVVLGRRSRVDEIVINRHQPTWAIGRVQQPGASDRSVERSMIGSPSREPGQSNWKTDFDERRAPVGCVDAEIGGMNIDLGEARRASRPSVTVPRSGLAAGSTTAVLHCVSSSVDHVRSRSAAADCQSSRTSIGRSSGAGISVVGRSRALPCG